MPSTQGATLKPMTSDPDERVCAACGCVEHKDGGRKCEDCADWWCDECWKDWPEADNGDQRECAECKKQGEEYRDEVDWSWRHR